MRLRAGAVLLLLFGGACQRAEDHAAEQVIEHAISQHGREAKVAIDRERGAITIELGAKKHQRGEVSTAAGGADRVARP